MLTVVPLAICFAAALAAESTPQPLIIRNLGAAARSTRPAGRDNVIVRLPGPDPAPPSRPFVPPPQTVEKTAAVSVPWMAPPAPAIPVRTEPAHVPALRDLESPKPAVPEEMRKDSASYLQRGLGRWTLEQAQRLLGERLRRREAIDPEKKVADGFIYAFRDPSGRYRELELDFDKHSGLLRTVFAYPRKLTWEECRRRWGSAVSTVPTRNGRTFHSYQDRRLDVLVDSRGQVVSLGMY